MKTKRALSLLLCIAMLAGTFVFQAYAENTDINVTFAAQKDGEYPLEPQSINTAEETAEEAPDYEAALNIVYNEFTQKGKYNSVSGTPLEFPIVYNSAEYTNLISYLKAWTLDKTGFEPEIEYETAASAYSYDDWTSGEKETYKPVSIDENGEMVKNYFKDNLPQAQRISNVYFTIGTAKNEKAIPSIYVKSPSLVRTDEEIVDYIASNLPFARIKGKNTSENEIVQPLGETTGTTVGALPTADKLYTKTSAAVSWSLENISGNENALVLKNNKITAARPEIGEDNAVFKLIANITSAKDNSITKNVEYTLTVPAYEAVYVPIQVTAGAKFTIKNVDEKYIVKQENAPEGYDLYLCALHTAATGTKNTYTYTAELENHITQSGSIAVTGEAFSENIVVDLPYSSEDDAKLKNIAFLAPEINGFEFDKDKYEYTVEVNGAQSVKIAASSAVKGADVKITSYYSSVANANKAKLTTTGKALDEKGVLCYLPDTPGTSVIEITVTAPSGSIQQEKTRKYTINVTKAKRSGFLTALALKAYSSNGGTIDPRANEETLTPSFTSGDNAEKYYYTVNYHRESVTVKPTAAGADIKVNGKTVLSGKESEPISLNTGDNEIKISAAKGGETDEYTIIVHRKAEFEITDIKLDKGYLSALNVKERTGSCSFENSADTITVTYYTNTPADITVTFDNKTYTAKSGEPIEIDVSGKDSVMPITKISHTVDGISEEQHYVVSYRRLASTTPSAVISYLPAPGQFVNVPIYQNPNAVIAEKQIITLGAFGGYAIFKYDNPIVNDSKNPYGIDFIIYGNAFTNEDGTTSSGAAEPAAVMVSKDGTTWYELAGAKYYSSETRHNISVTYTNGDTAFEKAADTLWTSSDGESGVMPKNDYHSQPYYPNPSYYGKYQNGIGKNETYNEKIVTFGGTMIESGFYPFGYADTHSKNENLTSAAAQNPYVKNHEKIYNGDGFDISWAVDENGNRVNLDEISYIKIYNPTLSYNTSTGEKSPEISAIVRANANDKEVGITSPLASLYVNGKQIVLEGGKFEYTIDAEKSDKLEFIPTAKNANANIYVSDTRVNSGEKCTITSVSKTRIIVQEDEKEPLIYIFNVENAPSDSDNASLKSINISPDDVNLEPDGENKLSVTVTSNTSSIRLTPKTGGRNASAEISGENLESAISLKNGETSAVIDISVGDNVFDIKVKSENGENEKTYTLTVTRKKASSSPSGNEITVNFTLTGDVIHYSKSSGKYTGNHKNVVWIKSQDVVIPKNSTVKYITELMFNNAKIDFTVKDGIYITHINGIGEFDNGQNSGWMYRINGVFPKVGYAAKTLSDGDVLEWVYTDDYTTEKNFEKWNDPAPSSSGKNTTVTDKNTENKPSEETNPTFNENTFADVKKDDWYYDAVKFAYEKGIIKGTEKGFEPTADMSRAMIVTVLWRMENSPVVNYAMKFKDAEDSWYTEAIRWAAAEGIVSGISDDMFGTDEPVTREMLAAFLYRYAKKKNLDVSSGENTNILSYSDAENVSEYAISAMQWAVGEGIVKGNSETTLDPSSKAQRAQCAALLMRFYEKYSK